MKELKVPAATPTCAMHSVPVVMNVDHPPRSHRIVQIDHSVSYMVMMHLVVHVNYGEISAVNVISLTDAQNVMKDSMSLECIALENFGETNYR